MNEKSQSGCASGLSPDPYRTSAEGSEQQLNRIKAFIEENMPGSYLPFMNVAENAIRLLGDYFQVIKTARKVGSSLGFRK